MVKLIKTNFNDTPVTFNSNGWINATNVAENHGKKPIDWLRLSSTTEYIERLKVRCPHLLVFVETKKGRNGGTWIHPKLAVNFARWISIDFAIWCDEQIDEIINGTPESRDWDALRHQAASSYKVMSAILDSRRKLDGKETKSFHYANEAKLVNWAMTGEYKPLDRESLTTGELDLLAKIEALNSVLISDSVGRDDRKIELTKVVNEHKKALINEVIAIES